ncbi:hypothetical protein DA075_24585 [Methylobacterium currus]|uniref:DUF6894 domain-containing protein n=1 Tax=Methylobacterium currus TaxID=2051553 RepID=A0A2R4WU64_9HYPH|nr:hypothetical protein [Methylobacterium currus]AWB25081.1 hypothetical protein DA075_24585 [Methylobacterium currus]UHC16653.1 hypothetical protein LRS73_01595 [Methylobacterium currus]
MTQRYFFNLVGPARAIEDPTGVEAGTPDQAESEARAVIAEMRASGDLPLLGAGWHLEIRDGAGRLLRSISLD